MNPGVTNESEPAEALIESSAEETEDDQGRRRLRKALALAERFKQKYHLEQQVSSELARRCDELKTQRKSDNVLLNEMRNEIRDLKFQLHLQSDAVKLHTGASSKVSTSYKLPASDFGVATDSRRLSDPDVGQKISVDLAYKSLIPETLPTGTSTAEKIRKWETGTESRTPELKLFEHFLVVGASFEAAQSLCAQLYLDSSGIRGVGLGAAGSDGTEELKLATKMGLMRRMMSPFSTSPAPPIPPEVSNKDGESSPSPFPAIQLSDTFSGAPKPSEKTSSGAPSPVMGHDTLSSGNLTQAPLPSVPAPLIIPVPMSATKRPLKALPSPTLHLPKGAKSTSSVATEVLYRFLDPSAPSVSFPPKEVADFCLPLGGRLTPLPFAFSEGSNDSMEGGQAPLGGLVRHSSKHYSADCFVFVLDDKTVPSKPSKEGGTGTGVGVVQCPGQRLYGICVQQTRRLYAVPDDPSLSEDVEDRTDICTDREEEEQDLMRFESKVCFAFITRFPLIEFFFKVIHEMLELDLARRRKAGGRGQGLENYVPATLLDEMLARLIRMTPPRYGDLLSFRMSPGPLGTVRTRRYCPSEESLPPLGLQLAQSEYEHRFESAKWCLPILLSPLALSVELLVRVLSLLLCEAKVVVIGSDVCLVSAAIMSLQSLLLPLEWVAPAISILPHKLSEFLECPVPLMAGLVVQPIEPHAEGPSSYSSSSSSTTFYFSSKELKSETDLRNMDGGGVKCSRGTLQAASLRAAKLLQRCGDGMDSLDCIEEGMLSAVLDMDEVELFLSGRHCSCESKEQFVMPGAQMLVDKLKACLSEAFSARPADLGPSTHGHTDRVVPKKSESEKEENAEGEKERLAAHSVQCVVSDHIRWLVGLCAEEERFSRSLSPALFGSFKGDPSVDRLSPLPMGSESGSAFHASTFEEVMSLALEDPQLEEEEVLSKVITAHAASMQSVLKSITKDDKKGRSDIKPTLTRSSSLPQVLTLRSSLRRFLTGNASPPIMRTPTSRDKKSETDNYNLELDDYRDDRGTDGAGMSVLLMSQELSLEGNQQAFLSRFKATQIYAEFVPSSGTHTHITTDALGAIDCGDVIQKAGRAPNTRPRSAPTPGSTPAPDSAPSLPESPSRGVTMLTARRPAYYTGPKEGLKERNLKSSSDSEGSGDEGKIQGPDNTRRSS